MLGIRWAIAAALLTTPVAVAAQDPAMPAIIPLEKRAEVEDRWLKERLDTLIPTLMRREGAEMWVMVAGEYNEDPVVSTMLPATWLSARRRTILLFHDRGAEGVERLALTRYPVGDFAASWDPDAQPDQWARLAEIIHTRNPKTIAVNMAEHFPLADGLSASHHAAIERAIGPELSSRIIAREGLALGWLETRIPAEMATYPTLSQITHAIILEAFSSRVITPGVTTSDEVVWYLRNRVAQLGLETWFQPSVAIQRPQSGSFTVQQMGLRGDTVIQPGDMLHTDFGISYLGLKTDVQRLAYVLKPGETDAPKGLRDGMARMNAVESATLAELKPGRSGDEVLAAARKRVEAQKIDGTIYSHALGYHGHGAGTWIGAWERQDLVPHVGSYRIRPDTAWSIELNAQHDVPEWGGQKVRFMYEENGYLDAEGGFRFLDGTQDRFILIPR